MENLFKKFIKFKRELSEAKLDKFEKEQLIHLDKDEIIEEGIFKFKNLKYSGFCTFYCGLSFWNIKSNYFKESRKASLRIKNFTRVYIIKDVADLNNEYLISQILEDIKANTRAFICHHDDIPEIESKKDFGIWDEEYVCVVEYNADNLVTGIVVSGRKHDLKDARQWQKNILKVSLPVASRADIEAVKIKFANKISAIPADRYKEFQHQSIELQMAIAAKECTASYVDAESCRWYHSSWPILRALNVVSTPNWHGDFYTKSISNYAKKNNKPLRILISASADATILEHLESAIGDLSKSVIWLIDLCPTPLEIGRLYTKLRNVTIHIIGELGNSKFDDVNRTFFNNLDWEQIKNHCKKFYIYYSDNDPYVSKTQAEILAKNLNISPELIHDAGHFNVAAGYTEFPQLLKSIK